MVVAGVVASCQDADAPNALTGDASVVAPTGDAPLLLTAGVPASRATGTNLGSTIPLDRVTTLSLGLDPRNIAVTVNDGAASTMTIRLSLAGGDAATACDGAMSTAEFTVRLDSQGRVIEIVPEAVALDDQTLAALVGGSISLCTEVVADFAGSVSIASASVDFTVSPGGAVSGSTNGNQNGNDNIGTGNGNDNSLTDDNANDNTGIDNDGDDANDNADANENVNGNDNDSDDGDNENDNSLANDNDDSPNANDNGSESDNSNDNRDDRNDNADDNDNDVEDDD